MSKPIDQLESMIRKEHSKEQRNKVITWIGDDKKRFDLLMKLFLGGAPQVVQRAAWALRSIGSMHPEWVKGYLDPTIKAIENPVHNAVVRNGLLVLVDLDIPKRYWGRLAELCFNYLTQVETPTATKRAALLIAAKICDQEPDLQEELLLVLQEQIPHSTVGFVNIAKKYIRKYTKK